ncbi:MAG: flavodoxin-dependent (E)-4-hydroxy-3-methylbut-2-enyl-diphosphate synthase, partial [Mycoplasmatales bacterium]
VKSTVKQILDLEEAGCQIIRVACPTLEDAKAIKEIKKEIHIPIVADIHFDYRIALEAINNDVDKIRLNPGNIGSIDRVKEVVKACKDKNIPIRIGINSGSLEKDRLEEDGFPTASGMVKSAKKHVEILESLDFKDIIISLKSSVMLMSIEAYKLAAKEFDYPLHLGITESGTIFGGTIKSSAGLGILLNEGIGNTMRVSISDDPVKEIKIARELLKNFNLISDMTTIISCTTCGRIDVDMIPIVKELEEYLQTIKKPIKVSVLGCAVNGPGEAKEADIGIACAKGEGLLFKKGKTIKKVPEDQLLDTLKEEISKL